MARHERAVARSLGFAQEAAAAGDLVNAVRWLQVVRAVDGGLSPDWERTLAGWIDRTTFAPGCEPTSGSPQTPNPGCGGQSG